MSSSARTDRSHDVNYPNTADARGSTRINHQRRPYYLGPFESPQSYVMFGLWKHKLMETGEAPETKDLRPLVDRLFGEEVASPKSNRPLLKSILSNAAFVFLGVSIIIGALILSSYSTPLVDGKALTEVEIKYISGLRNHQQNLAQRNSEREADIAEKTLQLMEAKRIAFKLTEEKKNGFLQGKRRNE